jgi:cell division protein FtsL
MILKDKRFSIKSCLSKTKDSKSASQVLVLTLFIITVFAAVAVTITTLTARGLEIREVQESSFQAQYAAEAGWERARYYIKENSPILAPVTIDKYTILGNCGEVGSDCNPLDNDYSYTTIITPDGQNRPAWVGGLICNVGPEDYCIDTRGETP